VVIAERRGKEKEERNWRRPRRKKKGKLEYYALFNLCFSGKRGERKEGRAEERHADRVKKGKEVSRDQKMTEKRPQLFSLFAPAGRHNFSPQQQKSKKETKPASSSFFLGSEKDEKKKPGRDVGEALFPATRKREGGRRKAVNCTGERGKKREKKKKRREKRERRKGEERLGIRLPFFFIVRGKRGKRGKPLEEGLMRKKD